MGSDQRVTRKRSNLYLISVLLPLTFLLLLLFTSVGFAQEVTGEKKESQEKFSYLIENGSRMIRENDFEKVFSMIRELPPEKKVDFRVRVIENFAYLKGYLVIKKDEYGRKWQVGYKPMVYTGDKSATPILIDLLKDSDPYMRTFTARALGYLGDHTVLEELEKVATQDQNSKVKSRSREAYYRISGKKLPGEP